MNRDQLCLIGIYLSLWANVGLEMVQQHSTCLDRNTLAVTRY